MLVTTWKGMGYCMVIYLARLQSIPQQLYEAEAIDWSDVLRKYWDITVPLISLYSISRLSLSNFRK